jgi:hypothetical protein
MSAATAGASLSFGVSTMDVREQSTWLLVDVPGRTSSSPLRLELSANGEPWQSIAWIPDSMDATTIAVDLSAYLGRTVRVRFVIDSGGSPPPG